MPQDDVSLTGEQDENASFSTHLRPKPTPEMPIELFLNMLRISNGGKLGELGVEIDNNSTIIHN
jgi:hypothetical protein